MFRARISWAKGGVHPAGPCMNAKELTARSTGDGSMACGTRGRVGYHTPLFLALAPGGMSASGQTRTSYHVFLSDKYHEGIYDKGHQFGSKLSVIIPVSLGGRYFSPGEKSADCAGETNESPAAGSIHGRMRQTACVAAGF